jgi:hypothetical protein
MKVRTGVTAPGPAIGGKYGQRYEPIHRDALAVLARRERDREPMSAWAWALLLALAALAACATVLL